MHKIPVWDLPLRIFHWSLAVLVVAAVITGKIGGNAFDWHLPIGYAILTLLLFRLVWGIVGGYHARFANFVRGPRTILAYLRGQVAVPAGHTPLGALSVIAMLLLLLVQGGLGLFANDDVLVEGPLYKLVSKDTSDWLTGWHKTNFYLILGLIGLHLGAILYYQIARRRNLTRGMILGHQEFPHPEPAPPAAGGSPALAVAVLAGCALAVRAVVTGL